eukprot:354314-Chlamydomonas_euryale.AAC.14
MQALTLRWMVLHVLAWLMADAAPRNTRPLGRPPAGASPTAARVDTNVPPVWKLLTATLCVQQPAHTSRHSAYWTCGLRSHTSQCHADPTIAFSRGCSWMHLGGSNTLLSPLVNASVCTVRALTEERAGDHGGDTAARASCWVARIGETHMSTNSGLQAVWQCGNVTVSGDD